MARGEAVSFSTIQAARVSVKAKGILALVQVSERQIKADPVVVNGKPLDYKRSLIVGLTAGDRGSQKAAPCSAPVGSDERRSGSRRCRTPYIHRHRPVLPKAVFDTEDSEAKGEGR